MRQSLIITKPVENKVETETNGNGTSEQKPLGSTVLQHQTSVGSMGSPEPMVSDDLPEELLEIGWRKFWSKRENMPYYFNKITNESLWEMPQLLPVSVTCSLYVLLNT